MQFNKMQDEALLFNGNNTLDADEVIDEILDVKVVAVGTTILVQVVIQTLGGSTLKLTVPVEGEPA
jgi:predicted thioesterase